MQWLYDLIVQLLHTEAVDTLIWYIVGFFLAAAFTWLRKRFKLMQQTTIDEQLEKSMLRIARSTYATFVRPLKKSDDWTPEKEEEARAEAIAAFKADLTTEQLKIIQAAHADVEGYIGSLLEDAVEAAKATGTGKKVGELANPPSS